MFAAFLSALDAIALWRFACRGRLAADGRPLCDSDRHLRGRSLVWPLPGGAGGGAHRSTFRRYVAPEVVDVLLDHPGAAQVDGGRRQVTVLFADVRGFTAYAESHVPEEVVSQLNRYLEIMAESVLLHGGMVDKFVGDGVMAVFGAPLPMEDHAERAVRAGLHMLRQIEAERQGTIAKRERVGNRRRDSYRRGNCWIDRFAPPQGVHCDRRHGQRRFETSGDGASRLARRERRDDRRRSAATSTWRWRPWDRIQIRGRVQAINLFRLTPATPEIAVDELASVVTAVTDNDKNPHRDSKWDGRAFHIDLTGWYR